MEDDKQEKTQPVDMPNRNADQRSATGAGAPLGLSQWPDSVPLPHNITVRDQRPPGARDQPARPPREPAVAFASPVAADDATVFERREVLTSSPGRERSASLLTQGLQQQQQEPKDDDVYMINAGEGSYTITLPSEDDPEVQKDIGWQAQLKIQQLKRERAG